ncbi:lantibiotic dehydratase [Aliiglaciecola litoralis]|uniref:Lantibiotic dehydratase n=1 Tax=Aliiglaciecola litoralis TaxID=582857 RepID=A0ABP3WQ46_9ALTE
MGQIMKSDNFFVIRTPRMSFINLFEIPKDRLDTRKHILEWLDKDGVIESLYIASPSLIDRLDTWKKSPNSKQGKKIELALLKYFIRMCSRPTPFGLFSGIHMGAISQSTQLHTMEFKFDKRKTRLDMFFLSTLKEYFQGLSADSVSYSPNNSLYKVANQYRYIQAYHSNNTRQFRLSAVEADEYFTFIMDAAAQGGSVTELAEKFVERYPNANIQDVTDYISLLIEESLLVANITLPITGISPDEAFLRSIKNLNQDAISTIYESALNSLETIDNKGAATVDDYKKLHQHLRQLPISVEENKLFQVDIYQDFKKCELDEKLATTLYDQITLIHALSNEHKNPLTDFINQFHARYEGQLVPLNLLLDDETGIGFSNETGYESSLIAGLNLYAESSEQHATDEPVSVLESAILHALSLPENSGKPIIQLDRKTLKKATNGQQKLDSLPASFAAIVSLFHDSNNEPIVKLSSCYGPSAANLLGRFCHLNQSLKDRVSELLSKEEQLSPDVIFAEVVHMPDGRPGNVIARPKLRRYEIVFMADTDIEDEYKISIDDLYVWVEDATVKLWSKRLKKQIIPRLSSAHNFTTRSLSIYKFLCTMQYQSSFAPNFSAPSSFKHAHFTPRIMLDNLILREKTWRIPRNELLDLFACEDQNEQPFNRLKQKYHLDQYVCFHNSDNVLHLDLKNKSMVEILSSETKNLEYVELKEALITQYDSPVQTLDRGKINNEVIIPFWNESAKPYQTFNRNISRKLDGQDITRRFPPGSKWLSLKLYSGNTATESLLLEQLSSLIEQCNSLYEKWFFIRYADPQWHLRVRFYGDPTLLYSELLPRLSQIFEPMLTSGALHKVELFTYEREVERYGGPELIELVESIFSAESDLVVNGLKELGVFTEDMRWRLVAIITDQLLELFNFSNEERLLLISYLRDGFGQEFNETGDLRKMIGTKYQTRKAILNSDLEKLSTTEPADYDEVQQVLFPLIHKWREAAQPLIEKINQLLLTTEAISKDELLESILHMTNNRVFKAYGREHEFAIHDFMRRYYLSKSKRDKIALSSPSDHEETLA